MLKGWIETKFSAGGRGGAIPISSPFLLQAPDLPLMPFPRVLCTPGGAFWVDQWAAAGDGEGKERSVLLMKVTSVSGIFSLVPTKKGLQQGTQTSSFASGRNEVVNCLMLATLASCKPSRPFFFSRRMK